MEVEEDEEVGFGSLGRAEDAWQQQSSIDLEKEKAKAVREQVKALRVVNDDLSRQLHEQGSLKRENAQLKALLTRQAKKIDALEEKEYELDQLSPWVRNPTNVTAAEELVRTFYAFACDVFEGGGEGDVFFEAGKQMERDGVGPLLPHCGRIFAAFVEGINEVRETYARSLPMIEVGKEAVAKNEKLVSEYQRLEAYSRETEQLLNASANDIDALKEECKVLKEECDKGESVIQSQQAVLEKMRVRMAWKSKAEEQIFVEDGRKLSAIIESMRFEKDKFQGRALRASKTSNSLSALVKNLRTENARFRAMLIEAKAQIPKPHSLIIMRSNEERLEEEYRRVQTASPGLTDVAAGCACCKALYVSAKHYRSEAEALLWKVQQVQTEYKEHTKANDAQLRLKIREASLELDSTKAQMDSMGRDYRKHVNELQQTIKEKEVELATSKEAAARRNQHKDGERSALAAQVESLEQELHRLETERLCGKMALQVLHCVASTGAEIVSGAADAQYLSRLLVLLDAINSNALAESSSSRDMIELAELLCRHDDKGELLVMGIVSRLLASSPSSSSSDAPIAAVVPLDSEPLFPLLMALCRSLCNGGRWRTQIDFDAIEKRANGLTPANLFEPLPCGTPFIEWVVHQAIACIGINDHFANAAKPVIDKERRLRQEQMECNQRVVRNIEEQIGRLMKGIDASANAPLYAEDATMLQALLEGASDASNRVAPFILDEATPMALKTCINDFQVCLTFLGRVCLAMHMGTYELRGAPKRARSPTYGK